MRRSLLLLLALTASALTGCGNKGPLSLPATRPATAGPAAPASAGSTGALSPASSVERPQSLHP